MSFANMKIGARMAIGFGIVLTLMIALITVGLTRFGSIGDINRNIIEVDWVKVEAANTVNLMTRANARRSLELLIEQDKAKLEQINERIAFNKKVIDGALETLDKLVSVPEGKALLAKIKQERMTFVASFSKVGNLIAEGNRDDAVRLMQAETLPMLDALQETIVALVAFQKKLTEARGAEAEQQIGYARTLMVGLGAAAVLLGIGLAYFTTRSITVPIGQAVKIAQTVAGGDLTSSINSRARDETGQLLHALKAMNDGLVKIVAEVRTGTDTIATASGQIASGNLDLSSRTEQQAGSLEETASSMEELTSTVRQNADHARQANQLAVSASEVARKGGTVMLQVVETMGSINESAKEIVDIVGVIDGIAFQTNILALNAAVEAARAGEQGRGFAVVASEVRNLAQRSAGAAQQIKRLIGDSVEQVEAGARLVNQAGSTMDEIVESVKRVTDIMGDITVSSQEQSAGIEQINEAINQMDNVTQQNAALVEEAAAAAASLLDQAGNLSQVVRVFKINATHAAVHPPTSSSPLSPQAAQLPNGGSGRFLHAL